MSCQPWVLFHLSFLRVVMTYFIEINTARFRAVSAPTVGLEVPAPPRHLPFDYFRFRLARRSFITTCSLHRRGGATGNPSVWKVLGDLRPAGLRVVEQTYLDQKSGTASDMMRRAIIRHSAAMLPGTAGSPGLSWRQRMCLKGGKWWRWINHHCG